MTSTTRSRPQVVSFKVSTEEFAAIAALATHKRKHIATLVRELVLEAARQPLSQPAYKPTEFTHGHAPQRYPHTPAHKG